MGKARDTTMEGVEIRGDRIRITFWWQGERCRETLSFNVSDANLRSASKLRKRILMEIEAGVFRYGDHFPDSLRARRLGVTPPRNQTFQEHAETWLQNKDDVRSASLADYSSALRRIWMPLLGRVRASDVTLSLVNTAISGHDWGSAKVRNEALIPLRGVLRQMFEDGAVDSNIADRIKNIKRQKPSPNPLVPDQVESVLGHIEKTYGPEMRNLFEAGIFTGLRPGELIALRWDDLDTSSRLLTVSRSRGLESGEQELADQQDATKTYTSRDVELNQRAMSAFKRQSEFTGKRKDIFICRTTNAPYASSAHLYKGVWVPTLGALGIKPRRMYQTRHTFATMNLMAGAHPAWIAEQLGHTNAQLVFTTYSKWIKAADKQRQNGLLDSWLANS